MASPAQPPSATPWLAQGEQKGRVVRTMFAEIAPTYDRLNDLMSLGRHRSWRRAAVQAIGLRPGELVVDLCTGTGDFLPLLRDAVGVQGRVLGLDFCRPMLASGRAKHGERLVEADACRLPLASGSADAITVGWGLRNVPDLPAALAEANRVLRPGGRFVSVDMTQPNAKFMRWASSAVMGRVLPWLGSLYGKTTAYRYLPESAARFAGREGQTQALEEAGFGEVRWKSFWMGTIGMISAVKR